MNIAFRIQKKIQKGIKKIVYRSF